MQLCSDQCGVLQLCLPHGAYCCPLHFTQHALSQEDTGQLGSIGDFGISWIHLENSWRQAPCANSTLGMCATRVGHMFVACLCPLSHASQQSSGFSPSKSWEPRAGHGSIWRCLATILPLKAFGGILESLGVVLCTPKLLNGSSCICCLLSYLRGFWTLNPQH